MELIAYSVGGGIPLFLLISWLLNGVSRENQYKGRGYNDK